MDTLPMMEFLVGGNHVGSNIGIGKAIKKVHSRSEEDSGKEDSTVDMHGRKIHLLQGYTNGGKSGISFNALLPQVTMVWKTRSSFQLMDMENDFYLVCFNDKDDYHKVMIGGPWVIFRQYLTVHPWMPDFLHTNIGIDAQVVWIRLIRLPEGYYFKLLGKQSERCLEGYVDMKDKASGNGEVHADNTTIETNLQQQLEEGAFGLWVVVEKRQYGRERNSSKASDGLGSRSFDDDSILGYNFNNDDEVVLGFTPVKSGSLMENSFGNDSGNVDGQDQQVESLAKGNVQLRKPPNKLAIDLQPDMVILVTKWRI
ncbi:hypothetical protein Goklo_027932 [Gossypium klotzschianum]|uniref:DUF4283 domain-containing protein n=1 Tax=Gossypium klotzschianum TaxID=34286 RepID=A0A7J8U063_9ROSI|nr:hypothetical protein [Gossypium klotzschianum]